MQPSDSGQGDARGRTCRAVESPPRDRQRTDGGPQRVASGSNRRAGSGPTAERSHRGGHSAQRSIEEPGDNQQSRAVGTAARRRLTTLRVLAVGFALFGVSTLYVGFETVGPGAAVPGVGAGFRVVGLLVLVTGGAYLCAGYGLWTRRRSGWTAGAWLVAVSTVGGIGALLVTGVVSVLAAVLVNSVLACGLHTNREPFRDRPPSGAPQSGAHAVTDTGQTATSTRQSAGGTPGSYASERRGRH